MATRKKDSRGWWLIKSEPDVYSIDDLRRDGVTGWEGVRNYEARNNLRAMRVGDLALFYHSNADPPGVAGIVEIVREAYPDPAQFTPGHDYADPKSPLDNPRWSTVDVRFVSAFPAFVPLEALKAERALKELPVAQKGTRLSVVPVTEKQFEHVRRMGGD